MKASTHPAPSAFAAFFILLIGGLSGQTLNVDWLELSGSGSSRYDLKRDNGSTAGSGELIVNSGLLFPGSPSSRTLSAGGWSSPPPTVNSRDQSRSVTGFEMRVAPQNGSANYQLKLSLPATDAPWAIAIGGLLRTDSTATGEVIVNTESGGSPVPITFLGNHLWSDTLGTEFDGEINWNEATGRLSTPDGMRGESGVAFLSLPPLSSAITMTVSVPAGSANATGDSIFIAVGTPIPEPAQGLLVILSTFVFLKRFR